MASKSDVSCLSPVNVSHVDVFWHEGMLLHDAVKGVFDSGFNPGFLDILDKHPENSDRIRNMISILQRGPIAPYVNWFPGRLAIVTELLSFHTSDNSRSIQITQIISGDLVRIVSTNSNSEYIDKLVEADKSGERHEFAPCTFLSPGSWEAALLAAGTALSAMQHILDNHGNIAYALVRPPGHHAQPTQADGYSFLNNAGLAVNLALNSGLCSRVAVIDIDVHYGNGTAEGFYKSDKVLTVSLHMNHGSWGPSHPQDGLIHELGEEAGLGYNLNVPLPNGTGDRGYEYAMNELVVPAVRKFGADMLVLVVGQDSSAFDPNGRQCLTMNGYRKIGKIMRGVSEELSNGRLLMVQEGGYHVTYAAYCLHALLEGVLKIPEPNLPDPIAHYLEDETAAVAAVESIKRYHSESVPFLKGT